MTPSNTSLLVDPTTYGQICWHKTCCPGVQRLFVQTVKSPRFPISLKSEFKMQRLFQDIRYGFRQLIKMPGFTLTAVTSLALGIGATTAVFSVVYAILVDPYPYAGADRMIHLRLQEASKEPRGFGLTGTQWQEFKKSGSGAV